MIAKFLVIAIFFGGVSLASHFESSRRSCLPSSETESFLLEKIRAALRHPNLKGSFASSGLAPSDQSRIQVVRVDSLCQTAALTINRDLHVPDTTSRSIHLFSVGKTFRAVDPTSRIGEFTMGWVLDSSLTRIEERLAM